jgi:hypothetical protein
VAAEIFTSGGAIWPRKTKAQRIDKKVFTAEMGSAGPKMLVRPLGTILAALESRHAQAVVAHPVDRNVGLPGGDGEACARGNWRREEGMMEESIRLAGFDDAIEAVGQCLFHAFAVRFVRILSLRASRESTPPALREAGGA